MAVELPDPNKHTEDWAKVQVHDLNMWYPIGDEGEIISWLEEHCHGRTSYFWGEARFELDSDAVYFKLAYK